MNDTPAPSADATTSSRASAYDVFGAFLKLGLTSFGGPVAHLGYFRDELVIKRKWLGEAAYAELVALCQFLPGPTSSQVGFALGLMRGGWRGALAAWLAFTLPSALLMIAFAYGATTLDGAFWAGLLHGLKLTAAAIVAQAVWGMARTLTPDLPRIALAIVAGAIVLIVAGSFGQVAALLFGALAGFVVFRDLPATAASPPLVPVSKRLGVVALATFVTLLLVLPLAAPQAHGLALLDAFYRAGALVFGGGHVVLPLLEASVVRAGWINDSAFLAGYGAAQAVPGPLFTFAAYLGAAMTPAPNGVVGALICLAAIFLPGFLILVAALPFWAVLAARPGMQAAMRGANAAVVGILAAALWSPVATSAIHRPLDLVVAAGGFALLVCLKIAPWIVVIAVALCGAAVSLLA